MNPKTKLTFGVSGYFLLMTIARVRGATNDLPALVVNGDHGGITSAMFNQVANNPSSILVISALCVFAWLIDDLPFLNSRYVAHLTVVIGAVSYQFFALPESVPHYFPHPQAVFVVNGIVAGFIAFIIHRQAVARLINLVRTNLGGLPPEKPTQLKPPI